MKGNINTKEYWDRRFSSGDWEKRRGRWQTESFARCQVRHLAIPPDFAGILVDFGCGLGDAIPVYKQNYPHARLIGVDLSIDAIELCRANYGNLADFIQGDHQVVPPADVIIASNIFEHLSADREVAGYLRSRCRDLYLTVPYKERPLDVEHVNTYDRSYFQELGEYQCRIFPCPGWSPYGSRLLYGIYLKNIPRFLLGRGIRRRPLQIMFHFKGLRMADSSADSR